MTDVRRWWRLLSASAVLAILAVAVVAGLARTPVSAGYAVRVPVAALTAGEPEPAEVEPGPILATYDARRATASFGAAAFLATSTGGPALTYSDIPQVALSAYQRASTVIDLADERCHLDWQLLAALGKVASDHGRVDGGALDDEGVARPAVLGPRLTGRDGTRRVADTDAGQVDGLLAVDRVVGPMMVLPSTWSVVAVDGDSDGRRDPQDLDDAALGVAVFLCAGPGDLRKPERALEQVGRYHPGAPYARAVMQVRADYTAAGVLPTVDSLMVKQAGALTGAPVVIDPTGAAAYEPGSTYQSPAPNAPGTPTTTAAPTSPTADPSTGSNPTTPSTPTPTSSPDPTDDPTTDPTEDPTEDPSTDPTADPTEDPTDDPTCDPSPTDDPTIEPSPTADPDPGCDDPTPAEDPSGDPEADPAASDEPRQVMGQLPLPPVPVVGRVVAPDVQLVRDALLRQ